MENFRIERLQIAQIGPFKDIDINFRPKKEIDKAEIHILTGGNGTGKSTVLQCLSFPKSSDGEIVVNKFWSIKPLSSFTVSYKVSSPPMKWFLNQGQLGPNHWIPILSEYNNLWLCCMAPLS